MRRIKLMVGTLLTAGMFTLSSCTNEYGYWTMGTTSAKEMAMAITPNEAETLIGKKTMLITKKYLEGFSNDIISNPKGPGGVVREICDSVAKSSEISIRDLHKLAEINLKGLRKAVLKNPNTSGETALMLKNNKNTKNALVSFLDANYKRITFDELKQFSESSVGVISKKAQRMIIRGEYLKEPVSKTDSIPPAIEL